MKAISRVLLIVLLSMSVSGEAMACSSAMPLAGVPQLTDAEKLAQVPLVFMGTVTAVGEGTATFLVEHMIRGNVGSQVTVTSGTNTCIIVFRLGTRWLYAGSETGSQSIPVTPETMERVNSLVPNMD